MMRAASRLAATAPRGVRGSGLVGRTALRVLSTKAAASAPPHPFESFLGGNSAGYIEDMYHAWRQDPESVHASWRSVFARMDAGAPPGATFAPPPGLRAGETLQAAAVPEAALAPSAGANRGETDYMKVMQLIHAYQVRGHNEATLDPLGLYDADLDGVCPPDLELENYGFTEADLDKASASPARASRPPTLRLHRDGARRGECVRARAQTAWSRCPPHDHDRAPLAGVFAAECRALRRFPLRRGPNPSPAKPGPTWPSPVQSGLNPARRRTRSDEAARHHRPAAPHLLVEHRSRVHAHLGPRAGPPSAPATLAPPPIPSPAPLALPARPATLAPPPPPCPATLARPRTPPRARAAATPQVNWIREQIETPQAHVFSKEEKLRMLDRLCWSDHFESFLANKYSTAKRFGLEGCEVLIVGMKELIDTATAEGVDAIVMGMPHRGR